MKGILTKDLYLIKKTCKFYLIFLLPIMIISMGVPLNTIENPYGFLFYFTVVTALIPSTAIPFTLISNDEKSGWNTYSVAMPYTRKEIVSSKYICSLMLTVSSSLICFLLQCLNLFLRKSGSFEMTLVTLLGNVIIAVFTLSMILPFLFKFGVEKGRLVYTIATACIYAMIFSTTSVVQTISIQISPWIDVAVIPCILILLALSWYLSVVFFQKREF